MVSKRSGGTGSTYTGRHRPEDFIVPGQDSNGNSIRVWCRVMPLLDRAIDVLFATRKFPFKAKGDLIRWCIKTGVDHLDAMEPCCGSVLAQVDAMLNILRDEEHNHAFLTVFHAMKTTVGMHIQAQALGEARRVVSMMHQQILKIEPGYWQDRYLKELEVNFGYLLNGAVSGAGLGAHADHGPDRGGIDED